MRWHALTSASARALTTALRSGSHAGHTVLLEGFSTDELMREHDVSTCRVMTWQMAWHGSPCPESSSASKKVPRRHKDVRNQRQAAQPGHEWGSWGRHRAHARVHAPAREGGIPGMGLRGATGRCRSAKGVRGFRPPVDTHACPCQCGCLNGLTSGVQALGCVVLGRRRVIVVALNVAAEGGQQEAVCIGYQRWARPQAEQQSGAQMREESNSPAAGCGRSRGTQRHCLVHRLRGASHHSVRVVVQAVRARERIVGSSE